LKIQSDAHALQDRSSPCTPLKNDISADRYGTVYFLDRVFQSLGVRVCFLG
jgi:hypothetical protein